MADHPCKSVLTNLWETLEVASNILHLIYYIFAITQSFCNRSNQYLCIQKIQGHLIL